MKRFTELYLQLDQTTSTNGKLAALQAYFADAPPQDAAWAIWFLSGRRLKRLVRRSALKQWVLEVTGFEEWILDECYQAVGDMAETIALLLPRPPAAAADDRSLDSWVRERLQPLGSLPEETQGEHLKQWWSTLSHDNRFVLNKLITGALRVGVSQRLVTRALANHLGIDAAVIAHRMMGDWQPSAGFMTFLASGEGGELAAVLPYPFFLASPLQESPANTVPSSLGEAAEWFAEWKWDGIRMQIVHREGQSVLWSRGEERLEGRFPEIEAAIADLPDGTVLDGEVVARDDRGALSFATLQRRIGRRKPGPTLLAEAPVQFIVYDLLEEGGEDIRSKPLHERRERLASLLTALQSDRDVLRESPLLQAADWDEFAALRDQSRERQVEGLMLKRRDSHYAAGRVRGDWWKWKVDPLTIDAVLLYAQPGSGRRSNLLTDYTFAVWDDANLITVCKAYSGLSNEEITELDRWIRRHTKERFGPVRSVEPAHVFEIAFEGIQLSKRHKSGIAFRFPRIARWRRDLSLADADSLDSVRALLP